MKEKIISDPTQLVIDLGLEDSERFVGVRKLTSNGGITIPVLYRRKLGLEKGDMFEIVENVEDGTITLRRIKGKCEITGDTDDLVNINGHLLSYRVIYAIRELGDDIFKYLTEEDEVDFMLKAKKIIERRQNREEKQKNKSSDKKKAPAKKKETTKKKEPVKKKETTKKKYTMNNKDREEIQSMHKKGASVGEISDKLMVGESTIKKFLKLA